jgi:hypothetical protein
VVGSFVDSDVERGFDSLVPRRIAERWPFGHPRYVGRDLSWEDWLSLADLD